MAVSACMTLVRPASRRSAAVVAITLAVACCSAPPVEGPHGVRSGERLVVVSIDGLMPAAYMEPDAYGLAVPTLRALVRRGAYASSVEGVFPTVTYPSHTTIATGVPPSVHGIVTNEPPDPLDKNFEGWRWYREDIAVPTLWDAVEADHRVAALVTWPVTVAAAATFVVPEYWRGYGKDDQKLLRALSTKGLLDRVAKARPDLWDFLTPPDVRDQAQFAIATYLVEHEHPDLLMIHGWSLDDAQHDHAPWSPEAKAAIETADKLIGELLATLEKHAPNTTFVLLSDHGFAPVDKEIRINAAFVQHHLIELDDDGKTKSARVVAATSGGTAYVYLLDPTAAAEADAAVAEFGTAVAARLGHDQIVAAGGDATAAFALVAAPRHQFSLRRTGPTLVDKPGRGTHGWPPSDPQMSSSFIVVGPGIAHRDLGRIRMLDIAPTLAKLAGVQLPAATGKPIDLR